MNHPFQLVLTHLFTIEQLATDFLEMTAALSQGQSVDLTLAAQDIYGLMPEALRNRTTEDKFVALINAAFGLFEGGSTTPAADASH